MGSLLIKNGRVIDPYNNIDDILDVLIIDNKITKVDKNITENVEKVIDATDNWVTAGFIDLHVHLREPGFEYKETIATGTRSAVMGGFTSVCCMPNTNPVVDNEIVVSYINTKAEKEGVCNVLPVGAITKGQNGEELAEIGKMIKEGICAISEDGKTIRDTGILKTALKYASMFDLPVMSHCEDINLKGSGVMNAGERAIKLGLKGISNDSEDVIVARDIIIAGSVNTPLHICHISTKGSVELVRQAKKCGKKVTAEVTPHHFSLTDEDIEDYDGNYKMSPPLRSKEDVLAIIEGLKDDTIEAIGTDHAPHHSDEKENGFASASNGIVGFETAFGVGITYLVEKGHLSPSHFISKLTNNPAKILNIDKGNLSVGSIADVTITNPKKEYTVDVNKFQSRGKNTPYKDRKLIGFVEYTIVSGKIIVKNGTLCKEYEL